MKIRLEKGKSEVPVFAYLRRSTTNKQEVSLENQSDNIDLILKKNSIDKDRVRYFRESHSAFENRKREQFNLMLEEIDKLKTPCILIARDPSRLSRNPNDSLQIANRIFGNNKAKKNIAKVFFYEEEPWDENTDRIKVSQTLADNYHESITTGKRSKNGVQAKLLRGEYVHRAPQGLSKKLAQGVLYLCQNEKMPFVKKAFEMKMAGITHKKIAKYLHEHGIRGGERDLNDRFFSNTVYIGTYTDKKTMEVFDNLKFFEGMPPISATLWLGVQQNRGKKKDIYGEKQKGYSLGSVLKTEGGRKFSGYTQKGTKQYKNTIEKIHISEKWVLEEFLSWLRDSILERLTDLTWGLERDYEYEKEIRQSLLRSLSESQRTGILKNTIESCLDTVARSGTTLKVFGGLIGDLQKSIHLLFEENTAEEKWAKKERLDELKKRRADIQSGIEKSKKNFLNLSVDIASTMEATLKEDIADKIKEIRSLDLQIEEIENQRDFDVFYKKVPFLLTKTFELAKGVLTEEQKKDFSEDLIEVLKIMTFELKIKKKKALEIELFGPVREVLFGKKSVMEAPAGVEPASRALQAPVGPFYQGAKFAESE